MFVASHAPAVDGTIYALRSLSTAPAIVQNRNLIHKIGVTTGRVETRIAAAKDDPTYLLAEVEVVASYDLKGIHPVKLENLLHRIFSRAQLDIEIPDRFGKPVRPREWFLVPLSEIDRAIDLIKKVERLTYNPQAAFLEYLEPEREITPCERAFPGGTGATLSDEGLCWAICGCGNKVAICQALGGYAVAVVSRVG